MLVAFHRKDVHWMAHKKTLILAPETCDLAEVTRMIEIAKAAREHFDILFTSYDGGRRNHQFIEQEGFTIREMQPALSEEDVQRLWRADRLEEFGDPFTEEMLEQRITSEQMLFREIGPAAALTGFCLSIPISARLAKVPLVWVIQTTWLAEYSEQFGTWPDAFDYQAVRVLPEGLCNWLARKTAGLTFWFLNRTVNKVAVRHGLEPFSGSSLVEGDYNLFAEPPEFSGLSVPGRLAGRHRFIGPLIARLNVEVPPAVHEIPRDLPIIYFAMGSSGVDTIVAEVIRAFSGQPYRVIAPVAQLLKRLELTPPSNVVVTDWLPAHKVNAMADVSVIHGGVGTLMTACLAGTPIVGIPNGNTEQEWNLECIVRKGFAIRLHKQRLKATDVLTAVERMLHDEEAKAKARAFQAVLGQWDGPQNAARFLAETFGS
jgi:UDP:flavonoid glycosyltransferase YjiC (YdhE family)